MMPYDPGLFLLLIMVCGMWWGYRQERKEWNHGICQLSGKPWKSFDMDSSGAIGFTDGCGNYTWMSWKSNLKQ